jgi:TPR repeat protein
LKKIFFICIFISIKILYATTPYVKQIKVWDDCTYAIEPIRLDLMQVRNIVFTEINAMHAIDVCKKSLQSYPNDAHVKFLLSRAYTKAKKYKKGIKLTSEACFEGDIGACNLLGAYQSYKLSSTTYDPKKKTLLWLWSCVQKNSQACTNLYNQAQWHDDYLPFDIKNAPKKIMLQKLNLCERGDFPEVCHDYAKSLFRDRQFTKQANIFEYTASRSCISGDSEGCLFYQSFLDAHKDDNVRQNRRIYVYKKSCNNGNSTSCLKVAHYYASKKRTKINNITALALYEDTCTKSKNVHACYAAGSYYLANLEGIIKNIPLGISYLEQSCTTHYTYKESPNSTSSQADISLRGCYTLATYLLNPPNKKYQNKKKAKSILTYTCNQRQYYYTDELGCKLGIDKCCKQRRH